MDKNDLTPNHDTGKVGALVARLIAVGTPAEIAASVVAESFAAGAMSCRQSADCRVDETTEKRRAYDRERQRKIRRQLKESADNPPTPPTEAYTLTIDNNINSKSVRARKHRIPPTWQPSAKHYEAAERLGIPRSSVDDKAEDMRNWAGANGTLKADWDLTFHGFLRRDAPRLAAEAARTGLTPTTAASLRNDRGVFVARDHPAFEAWNQYEKKRHPINRDGGWYFPSEWPPTQKSNGELPL